jgi:NADH-quinone oxidoreductase subunit N
VPPLAGFLAKLYVFGAAVRAELVWLAVFGVVNSVISAYYYLRVVVQMYMREGRPAAVPAPVSAGLQVGVIIAAVAIVLLGLWPGPIVDLARVAALALLGG